MEKLFNFCSLLPLHSALMDHEAGPRLVRAAVTDPEAVVEHQARVGPVSSSFLLAPAFVTG